jgi:predicted outer membrane protein
VIIYVAEDDREARGSCAGEGNMIVLMLWTLLGGTLEGFGDLDRNRAETLSAWSVESPLQVVAAEASRREAVAAGVVHLVNRIAIASARIAVGRSRRAAVRAFASTVIAEHDLVERRLQIWLADHRVAGHLLKDASPQGEADHLRMPDRLRKTSPRAFDRTFLRATFAMASRSQRFLEAVGAGGKEGDLRGLLGEVSGLLRREQVSAARLLGGSVDPAPKPAPPAPAAAQPRS